MKPGGVLHTSKAYAHAIFPSERGIWCEQCLEHFENQGKRPNKCAQCKVVFYCSKECQREDWTFHKLECKCFKRVSPWIPSEYVILFSRLLQRHNQGDHKTVSETICGRKVVFNDLLHHVEEIRKDVRRINLFRNNMTDLQRFLGGRLTFPMPDELLKLFGRVQVNSFSIMSSDGQTIGVGMFLGFSAINHSCRPNAIAIMDGVTVMIRTIIDVPDNALETYCSEIRITYINQLSLTEERRSKLRERYYFTCDCPMCSDQHMDALMQSVKCPQPNCDGPLICQEEDQVHVCTTCNAKFSNNSDVITNYRSLVTTTKSTLQNLNELGENRETEELFNRAVELFKLQKNTFHKMNIYRVKTLIELANAACDTARFQQASEYALAALEAYEQYLCGKYNPKVGLLLRTIGMSLFCNRQLRESFEFLQRAESILAVALGGGTQIYDSVKQMRDVCFNVLNRQ